VWAEQCNLERNTLLFIRSPGDKCGRCLGGLQGLGDQALAQLPALAEVRGVRKVAAWGHLGADAIAKADERPQLAALRALLRQKEARVRVAGGLDGLLEGPRQDVHGPAEPGGQAERPIGLHPARDGDVHLEAGGAPALVGAEPEHIVEAVRLEVREHRLVKGPRAGLIARVVEVDGKAGTRAGGADDDNAAVVGRRDETVGEEVDEQEAGQVVGRDHRVDALGRGLALLRDDGRGEQEEVEAVVGGQDVIGNTVDLRHPREVGRERHDAPPSRRHGRELLGNAGGLLGAAAHDDGGLGAVLGRQAGGDSAANAVGAWDKE